VWLLSGGDGDGGCCGYADGDGANELLQCWVTSFAAQRLNRWRSWMKPTPMTEQKSLRVSKPELREQTISSFSFPLVGEFPCEDRIHAGKKLSRAVRASSERFCAQEIDGERASKEARESAAEL